MSLTEQLNEIVNRTIEDYISELAKEFNIPRQRLFDIWEKKETHSTSTSHSHSNSTSPRPPTPTPTPNPQSISLLSKLGKNELIEHCKAKGFKISGTKQELIDRLTGVTTPSVTTPSKSITKSKTPPHPEKPTVISKLINPFVPSITVKRNKYNRHEHVDTKFILHSVSQKVIGKQNYETGEVDSLTTDDIETCKKYKLQYQIPENLDAMAVDDDEEEEETVVVEDDNNDDK